jgi:hypothetical protein
MDGERHAAHQNERHSMKTKRGILRTISLGLGLAVALAFASGCATNTGTGDQMKPMTSAEHQQMLSK